MIRPGRRSVTRKTPRYERGSKCCAGTICLTVAVAGHVFIPGTVLGQETASSAESALSEELGVLELETIESRPLFRTSDLIYAGVFLGSLAFVQGFDDFDEALSPGRPPTGLPQSFYSVGNIAGNGFVGYGVSGATFLAGKLIGDRRIARIGVRSIEALVLADLLVTPFKVGVGRMRPSQPGAESDEFVPGSFSSDYNSFPSGHTAHMFALASTISREFKYEAPWVPFVAYPIATLVGASRVIGKKHWVTDVVAGAAAGLFAGHVIGRLHGEELISLRMTPVVSASSPGVYLGASVRLP